MLKNKTTSAFVNSTPIQVVRTITPDGGAPGSYQCAIDSNQVSTCSNDVALAPNLGREHVTGGDFYILDKTKTQLITSNGILELPHVVSFTPEGTAHNFYGMQVLSAAQIPSISPGPTIPAVGSSLKLGTFSVTPTSVPGNPQGATNCVSIYWDPFGRVIDAKTLEPIQNVQVTLKNLDASGNQVLTSMPGNPLFKNPYSTNAGGSYTFGVSEGTYFLLPSHNQYTFPVDQVTLQNAITQLKQIDPQGQFVDTTKIYNNSQEPIYEQYAETQRRDILMINNSTSLAKRGSVPAVINAVVGLNNNNQVITGIVSHPRAVVTASVNGTVLAQTTASMNGHFQLTIPSEQLPADTASIDLNGQSTPLTATQTKQTSTTLLHVAPVPLQLGGFVYNTQGIGLPNTQVVIVIPSMNNMIFTSTTSDKDGFISIPATQLPPFPYTIQVRDQSGSQIVNTLSIAEFQKINTPYYQATGVNIFSAVSQPALAKPAPDVLAKIKTDSAPYVQRIANAKLSLQPTNSPTDNSKQITDNKTFILLATLAMIAVLGGIVIVLYRLRKPGSPFENTQTPLA